MSTADLMLTTRQVADLIGISPRYALRLIEAGQFEGAEVLNERDQDHRWRSGHAI